MSTPIIALYYTALVGDKKHPPTLKAKSSFSGIAVIDADPYLAGGANMYTNQNNFFRTVRNFNIDLTAICATCGATGLHWQVAQATSLVVSLSHLSTCLTLINPPLAWIVGIERRSKYEYRYNISINFYWIISLKFHPL